jgi:hypothetical protein
VVVVPLDEPVAGAAGEGVPGAGDEGAVTGGAGGGGELGTCEPVLLSADPLPLGEPLPGIGAASVGRSSTTLPSNPSLLLDG